VLKLLIIYCLLPKLTTTLMLVSGINIAGAIPRTCDVERISD